jgi:hypothetical protein
MGKIVDIKPPLSIEAQLPIHYQLVWAFHGVVGFSSAGSHDNVF